MDKKIFKTSLIFIAFKKALKNSSILKSLSLKFGFYFLGLSFFIFFIFSVFLPEYSNMQNSRSFLSLDAILVFSLLSLSSAFNIFIIPYYAYKETYNSSVPDFWDFISRTIYPIVIAHIKAILLILLFALLLIIPGVYKKIRFSFLNETVFFDSEKAGSNLKKADQSTRSFFWPLVLFLFLSFLFSAFFVYGANQTISFLNLPVFLFSSLKLVVSFYVSCFLILWKTLFYFEIKKLKGEPISLFLKRRREA